jgi:hypothetical protein
MFSLRLSLFSDFEGLLDALSLRDRDEGRLAGACGASLRAAAAAALAANGRLEMSTPGSPGDDVVALMPVAACAGAELAALCEAAADENDCSKSGRCRTQSSDAAAAAMPPKAASTGAKLDRSGTGVSYVCGRGVPEWNEGRFGPEVSVADASAGSGMTPSASEPSRATKASRKF